MVKRKGQGMPLSVIITGVIVVVVAIVLILTTTEFGKKLMGLGGATPSALEAATQGCITAARNNLITDYCYNLREVGNSQYVNCEDMRVRQSLTQQGIALLVCDNNDLEVKGLNDLCSGLTTGEKNSLRYNGESYTCPATS